MPPSDTDQCVLFQVEAEKTSATDPELSTRIAYRVPATDVIQCVSDPSVDGIPYRDLRDKEGFHECADDPNEGSVCTRSVSELAAYKAFSAMESTPGRTK